MPRGKIDRLGAILRETGGALVAFSAGVDSAFLLSAAREALGERAVAATVVSAVFPRRELIEASEFCRRLGIRHETVHIDVVAADGFADNAPDRCYRCKKHIFTRLMELARRLGLSAVLEGSNADDEADFRPGLKAVAELGIRSPLREAGLTKREIRLMAKDAGLEMWDKPAAACLASRFAYGEKITPERLEAVERAEDFLARTVPGLGQLRVRFRADTARIEVPPEAMSATVALADVISAEFKRLGFVYTALDLEGYRTGSMNEALSREQIAAAGGEET